MNNYFYLVQRRNEKFTFQQRTVVATVRSVLITVKLGLGFLWFCKIL